jgi:hypothetical protein
MLGDGIPNNKDKDIYEVCIPDKRERSPRDTGCEATRHPTLSVGTDTGRFSCYLVPTLSRVVIRIGG